LITSSEKCLSYLEVVELARNNPLLELAFEVLPSKSFEQRVASQADMFTFKIQIGVSALTDDEPPQILPVVS
jgi:hypothetical protein